MVEVITRDESTFEILGNFHPTVQDREDWGEIKDLVLAYTAKTGSQVIGEWLVSTAGQYGRVVPFAVLLNNDGKTPKHKHPDILGMARHLVYRRTKAAYKSLINFTYNRRAMAGVITKVELPASTMYTEDTLRALTECPSNLLQYFTEAFCVRVPPSQWLKEMNQHMLLDKVRTHKGIDMNAVVSSFYDKLSINGEALTKARKGAFNASKKELEPDLRDLLRDVQEGELRPNNL